MDNRNKQNLYQLVKESATKYFLKKIAAIKAANIIKAYLDSKGV